MHTVLVPPLLCSTRVYDPLLPALWTAGSVAVADTRRDESFAGMAARLLDAAPPRFALAGTSMGGYVALEVVRQAPDRVVALALIATSARPDAPEQAESRQQQHEAVEAGRFDAVVDAVFPALVAPAHAQDPELLATWRTMAAEVGPDAFRRQLRAVAGRADSRPLLPTIGCPTAVIHGAEDRPIPLEHARELADGIPGARLTVVAGSGHLVPWEDPAAVSAALADLLAAV